MTDRPRLDSKTLIALALVIAATGLILKDPSQASDPGASAAKPSSAPIAAVEAYETARSADNPIELCARAGAVAAAYLRAKDVRTAETWSEIEDVHCTEARFWQSRVRNAAYSPSESAPASDAASVKASSF